MEFSLGIAFVIGFLPPLLWLWFWLGEDVHPEPLREVALVFLIGMVAVFVSFMGERAFFHISSIIGKMIFELSDRLILMINIIAFASIEEVAKTGAAVISGLRSRYYDEPVDAMIYLIAASLGFAALENMFFIIDTLGQGIHESLSVAVFRFANAVLIHASTGAIIGSAFAFSFCDYTKRMRELGVALVAAISLHTLYNFFITQSLGDPFSQIKATLVVVLGALISLFLFERAKKLRACLPMVLQ